MADTSKLSSLAKSAVTASPTGGGPSLPANMKTPNNLQIRWSGLDSSKPGVWSMANIPQGMKFGPFGGEKVVTLKKDSDALCVWEIVDLDTKEFLFYLDGTKMEQANWLRHVQCARHADEQNIIAEQEGIDIMYRALKPIEKGQELLTWYKTPTTRRGQRLAGRLSGGKAKKENPLMSSTMTKSPTPKAPVVKSGASPSPASPKKKAITKTGKAVATPKGTTSLPEPCQEVKESPRKEENTKKVESTKKVEIARKVESTKKVDSPKKVQSTKKAEGPKKLESTNKVESTKKVENTNKSEIAKKEEGTREEENAKKEEASKKMESTKAEVTTKKMTRKEEGPNKGESLNEEEVAKKIESTTENEEIQKKEVYVKKAESKLQVVASAEVKPAKNPGIPAGDTDKIKGEKETCSDNEDPDDGEIDEDDDDDEDEDDDNETNDSDVTLGKCDLSKSIQSEDPGKFHFKLKKAHITKNRNGRKQFKCDICAGIYKHAFSLKRHYIRNHINLKYVSRGDILNCQINPETHDAGSVDDKDSVNDGATDSQAESPEKDRSLEMDSADKEAALALIKLDSHVNTPLVQSGEGVSNKKVTPKKEKPVSSESSSLTTPQKSEESVKDSSCPSSSGPSALKDDSFQNGSSSGESDKNLGGLYRCNVCSSFFDSVTSLKSHLDNHPNLPSSKAFACNQCDMKFAHKQNLRRHLAVHTGEKPFLCNFCGKTFPTATNQKRHERIHLGRRVKCEYCSSTFTQSGDLKKHIRKLHPECFHECAFCGKYFTDEEDLIEHVVSHNESMQSNEAEKNRRKHAFKVDMELDRIESMRLAEQKTPGVKFACTVCKKRFLDYANMCRHRRLAHQRHLLLGVNGSNSASPVPSPTKLPADNSDGDPQAFFYANVANNISENLTNYLEGTKEHIERTASQFKLQNTDKVEGSKPMLDIDPKEISKYNFPAGFNLKQNFRKIMPEKAKTVDKPKPHIGAVSGPSVVNATPKPFLGDCLPKGTEVKVVKVPEDGSSSGADHHQVKNKDEIDMKPVISVVNGVSLNIPVFNLSNIAKRDVKNQPVCTVQPIQRQNHLVSDVKTTEAVTVVQSALLPSTPKPSDMAASNNNTGDSKPNTETTPSSSLSPTPITALPMAVKLVTKSSSKSTNKSSYSSSSGNKSNSTSPSSLSPGLSSATTSSSSSSSLSSSSSSGSCLALKIPQVHVCPVCRRLFNNEAMYQKHMVDKHKTNPEQQAASPLNKEKQPKCEKDSSGVTTDISHSEPVMDLSGKSQPPVTKPSEPPAEREKAIIDHDEGARLLLDFALGIRDEPKKSQSPVKEAEASPEDPIPLDLSKSLPSSGGKGKSKKAANASKSAKLPKSSASCTVSKLSVTKPTVAPHGSTRVPAAHTGQNHHGKVQGLLRIPTFHASKDLDLPAPLTSPPGTPRSPWQPQLPSPLCAPQTKPAGSGKDKKFICTVCYGEFHNRGLLQNHQRSTHTNVRCDHVEVDTDVVAPWWQKPSPVGMLNVCSNQMSELNQTDQQQLKCTKCQKSFSASKDLHSHILECASIGKKKTSKSKATPTTAMIPTPKVMMATTTMVTSCTKPATLTSSPDDAEAAAVAAAGLRLLAASHPRLPMQGLAVPTGSSTTGSVPASSHNPGFSTSAFTANTVTTGAIPGVISSTTESSAGSTSMLERFKTSFLKKMKKKKKKREQEDALGLMTKKRRRSLELLYNPQNHVRRREMTEVVDMQCCQGCGQRFTTISLLERHIPFCTQKERLKEIQVIRNPLDGPGDFADSRNLCHYCSKQFTYAGMLRKHVFEICQTRKTRIQECKPLDVSWEQELALHYIGPSSVETCSNDGSQVDDTASIATSTSSSHDAESTAQRSRRRKRKNRGWGNGKKKRSASSSNDRRTATNEDVWSQGSGTPAAGEEDDMDDEDIDDDLECDESLSDLDIKAEDSKVISRPASGAGWFTRESSQSGDELRIVEDKIVDVKASTNTSTIVRDIPSNISVVKHEPLVKNEPVEIKPSPPIISKAPVKDNAPQQNPQHSFIGRHALPVVLSVPQYRERTPITIKPKATPKGPFIGSTPVQVTQKSNTPNIKQNPGDLIKTVFKPIEKLKSTVLTVTKAGQPSISDSTTRNGAVAVNKTISPSKKPSAFSKPSSAKTTDSTAKSSTVSKAGGKTQGSADKIATPDKASKVFKSGACHSPLELKRLEVPSGKLIAVANKKLCLTGDQNIIQMGKVLTNSETLSILKSVVSPKIISITTQPSSTLSTATTLTLSTSSTMNGPQAKVITSLADVMQKPIGVSATATLSAGPKKDLNTPEIKIGLPPGNTTVVQNKFIEQNKTLAEPMDRTLKRETQLLAPKPIVQKTVPLSACIVKTIPVGAAPICANLPVPTPAVAVPVTTAPVGPVVETVKPGCDPQKEQTVVRKTPAGADNAPVAKPDSTTEKTQTEKVYTAEGESEEESSDEEDIKEIINTVLAQRRQQGQKQKTLKSKKPKKSDTKSASNNSPEKSTKSAKPTKKSPESVGKEQKEKIAAEKDVPKAVKIKSKKKAPEGEINPPADTDKKEVLSNAKPPEKEVPAEAKAEVKKNTNAINLPKKTKEKAKKATEATAASKKDEPPNKKKKVNEKDTNGKASPKKPPKTPAKTGSPIKATISKVTKDTVNSKDKIPAPNSNDSKKTENGAAKPPTKTKAKASPTKQQSESPNQLKNRKRKAANDASDQQSSPCKDTASKSIATTGPSPKKQIKTRGGSSAACPSVAEQGGNNAKNPTGSPANKRRLSNRGARANTSEAEDSGTKGKAKPVPKTSPAKSAPAKVAQAKASPQKLKRSVSATPTTKKATSDERGAKGRVMNGKTPMRTRQSRLSV